jgi:hypothetical protein
VLHGDCVALMSALGPVDAIVTDPPYGLEFMGVAWDKMRENGTPRTRNEWGDFGSREHARRPIETMAVSFTPALTPDLVLQAAALATSSSDDLMKLEADGVGGEGAA